jgi:branched-chain amino acid transport system permease protein
METRSQATFHPPREVHRFPVAQYLILFVVLSVLPFLVPEYLRSVLSKIYIFAIFAMSLNLVLGYTGLISLGHAAYLGVGGYTLGILMTRFGTESLWIVFPAAVVASALVAAFIGFIALRVSGMHFILITIAFGQLLYAIAVKWRSVTGSTDGLIGITYPAVGVLGFQWTAYTFHYFILLLFVICCLLMHLIAHSSFGYALVGIRENEPRMQGLGYHTWLFKYLAFILGGAFAGVAGALFAPFYGIMVPSHFGLLTSSMAVLMVVLGSPGTLHGPLIGSFLIVLLEFFASIYSPERWPLILGGAFIVCITLFRGGLGIHLARAWTKAGMASWKS